MIKKNFFAIFVILLLVFVLGCFSNCWAYSWDDFCDFIEDTQDLQTNSGLKSAGLYLLNNRTYVETQISNLNVNVDNYSTIIMKSAPSSIAGLELYMYTKSNNNGYWFVNSSNNVQFSNGFNTYGQRIVINKPGNNSWNESYRFNNIDLGKCWGLLDTEPTDGNFRSAILQNKYNPRPQIYFMPNYDEIVNVDSNFTEVNCLKRDYSLPNWTIGTTTNFNELLDFIFTLRDNTTFEDIGFIRNSTAEYSNGALYYDIYENKMFVNSRFIQYNRVYTLSVSMQTASESTTVDTFDFIFLPLNSTITNGVITNVGSGDYSVQDSTNEIISSITDDGDIDNVLNEYLPSGDITDIATSNFQFTLLDNPFSTFLWHLLDSVYGALVDTGNVTLEADYKTLHFELNSDDFTLPDSEFKTFLRTVLIFLYIYGNYRYFHYLISLLETANIDRVIAELGTDEFYDSDIKMF